jgi:hypothetical protein
MTIACRENGRCLRTSGHVARSVKPAGGIGSTELLSSGKSVCTRPLGANGAGNRFADVDGFW